MINVHNYDAADADYDPTTDRYTVEQIRQARRALSLNVKSVINAGNNILRMLDAETSRADRAEALAKDLLSRLRAAGMEVDD